MLYYLLFHFNSIKVRLEHAHLGIATLGCTHFNSIKVRLEHIAFINAKELVKEFQFHKGAIRTR